MVAPTISYIIFSNFLGILDTEGKKTNTNINTNTTTTTTTTTNNNNNNNNKYINK